MQANLREARETQTETTAIAAMASHLHDEDERPIRAANSELVSRPDQQPIAAANRDAPDQPKTLEDVAHRIQREETTLVRLEYALAKLRMEGNDLVAGDTRYRLNNDRFGRVCSVASAPADYLKKLGVNLRNRNLEHCLKQAGKRENGLNNLNSRIVSRNDEFIGFERSDLYQMKGRELIEAVGDGLGDEYKEGMRVQNFSLSNECLSMDLVTQRDEVDVYKGDIVQAGIHVEYSLLGEQATAVVAYILRLACLNGMTHRECVGTRQTNRTRRIENSDPNAAELQMDQVRKLVAATVAKLPKKLKAIQGLTKPLDADKVDRVMEQFLRRGRLYSQNMMQVARNAWVEPMGGNRQETYFGALNALTWMATHPADLRKTLKSGDEKVYYSVTPRQRQALSVLAGIFANQHDHLCPECFGSGITPETNA